MPIANFKCVREVTSEDANYMAENLLKQDTGKKWKTKSVGQKTAYCIFELTKPARIVGIDIGNEHSAFVEVLVSNSGCRVEDFKEILITCSFMTPIESKNSINPNRVRCFNREALVSSVAEEKWHLVKVICTQPFNKHCQYGLSFIKLHITEGEETKQNNTPKVLVPEKFLDRKISTDKSLEQKPKTIGKFALREESPDSESESSAALFSRWKKARQSGDSQLTTAASIRQASNNTGLIKLNRKNRQMPSINDVPKEANGKQKYANQDIQNMDRNRNDLAFGSEDDAEDEKSKRLSKHIEAEKQRLLNQKEGLSKKEEKKTNRSIDKSITKLEKDNSKLEKKNIMSEQNENPSTSRKRRSSPNAIEKQQSKKPKAKHFLQYRPFDKLLQGVVLVISGIQNPDRANLRSKALAMGAKYKADWESGCTHLICAFKNTPKYNQVKGKGKIVMRSWIEKCFDLKKYLPWRRYALDSDEQAKPDSDSEILDESLKPADDGVGDTSDEIQRIKATPHTLTTESEESREGFEEKSLNIDSGSDTDDYIEDMKKKSENKENSLAKKRDVYEVTTEEEDFVSKKTKSVPAFFKNLKFLISEDLKNVFKQQLVKCIKHYGGSTTSDIKQADYFVVDTILDVPNFSGEIVNPQWVFECNDMEQKIDITPYLVRETYSQ